MRWFVLGALISGGGLVLYSRQRYPASWERVDAQLRETMLRTREAAEMLDKSGRLLLEEIRELLRQATEEGREASIRTMADLQERFRQLQRESSAVPNTTRPA